MKLFQELRVLEFFEIRVGLLADFSVHFDAVELDEARGSVVVVENFSLDAVINEDRQGQPLQPASLVVVPGMGKAVDDI